MAKDDKQAPKMNTNSRAGSRKAAPPVDTKTSKGYRIGNKDPYGRDGRPGDRNGSR